MSTRSLALAAALLAAAPATALHAQPPATPPAAAGATTPDYSGTWALDPAKSDFGPQAGGAPARMTMRVRHAGTSLQIVQEASTPMGDQRDSVAYTIGGPAVTHALPNVGPAVVTAAVEGGKLVTKATIQTQGIEVPVRSTWTLSPDGKVLTVDRTVTTPMGDMPMRLVFNKQ